MFKGSGLIRVHPRFNAPSERAASTGASPHLQHPQSIFRSFWKITISLCLMFAGVIALLQFALNRAAPENPVDIFAPYRMVYPGVALANLSASDCVAHTISPYTHEEQCDLRLHAGDSKNFSSVTITLHDGHVGSIRFVCNDLYVGDLVGQWGRPDEITRIPGGYLLHWTQNDMLAVARGSQWFNYRLPVETVLHT